MFVAKVMGNVVATKKSDTLVGYKLMIVQPVDSKRDSLGNEQVAADYVGAGVGEYVLLSSGSAVRVEEKMSNAVIDLAIVGIIDDIVG